MDAVIIFKELFIPIFHLFDNIQEWCGDRESSEMAFILQQVLRNGNFLVSLVVIREIFVFSSALCLFARCKTIDSLLAIKIAMI